VAVLWVPSRRAPGLVADLATGLASELRLPALDCIEKLVDNPPQKAMENSAQQVKNLLDGFGLRAEVPSGPVLLVDDVVDSRWTFTIVGGLVRAAGCPAVHPVALASATGR
jgi:ATP-dependent DNA helicase RecQ